MSLADTIVEILHALRDSRRERDVYREIALSAIHRLHEQSVQMARQQKRLRRLENEVRHLRSSTHAFDRAQ
jgi:hypothetical protein